MSRLSSHSNSSCSSSAGWGTRSPSARLFRRNAHLDFRLPAYSPRVILVERFGVLVGLVSVKDCLRYTIEHEAGHDSHARADELEATLDELRLWWRDSRRWIVGRFTGRTPPESPDLSMQTPDPGRFGGVGPELEAYELSSRGRPNR